MRLLLPSVLALSLSACVAEGGGRCCPPPCEPAFAPAAAPAAPSAPAPVPATTATASPSSAPALDAETPDALWAALLEGNARYREGRAARPRQDAARRAQIATKQTPKVVVLACADSRVAPEVLFDQGLGDLFVVRVAGNVATPEVAASVEYAVEHLGARLVVVLGHERCGAVGAALAGGEAPGHLPALLAHIKPAVDATPADDPDRANHAIATNARLAAEELAAGEILAEAAHAHHVEVRAAVYDLDTGAVTAVPTGKAAERPAAKP